ncbi:hypothetical protein SAMN02745247_02446 [Butyrivibrio hungatei DSM 14810]|uniref:Uncharacterized protein n=1 Tax=Butyrivibrio hungatei DSM 14810 TaxID=1121132 RepID=A0A1M7SUC2_9FIRM|nr:hypothetical protein [Butyrivibrio hungatei]SHN62000.1 hypothetical protein SAMN02745247_02446 [Butyrivibrio hungatei DSM 14810]
MRKNILLAIIAATIIMEGCSVGETVSPEEKMPSVEIEEMTESSTEDSSEDCSIDSPLCGCYGEYKNDHYLIISDGMEEGSFDIEIHIDDSKELKGYATIYEYPDSKEVLLFTSEDGTVKGTIDGFETDVTFYVSETDGAVVGQEEAYSFEGKN